MSQTEGSTGSERVGRGGVESGTRRSRSGDTYICGLINRKAPNLCRSLPKRGAGHEEMTKKCEKGKPSREHERGRVLGGHEAVPSIPITEIGEGTVGPK